MVPSIVSAGNRALHHSTTATSSAFSSDCLKVCRMMDWGILLLLIPSTLFSLARSHLCFGQCLALPSKFPKPFAALSRNQSGSPSQRTVGLLGCLRPRNEAPQQTRQAKKLNPKFYGRSRRAKARLSLAALMCSWRSRGLLHRLGWS